LGRFEGGAERHRWESRHPDELPVLGAALGVIRLQGRVVASGLMGGTLRGASATIDRLYVDSRHPSWIADQLAAYAPVERRTRTVISTRNGITTFTAAPQVELEDAARTA
jgi:hypothetical protein